jgi:hypothetical protein
VDGHAGRARQAGRRKHVDERASRPVVAFDLVGLTIGDEQVAIDTDREAERIAQGASGRGHPDECAA